MRFSASLVLVAIAVGLFGCGDSHNVTFRNECQETVDVQITAQDGKTVSLNGIDAGKEDGATIGLGPMDVKAVFTESGDEAVTGFKSESDGSYRFIIRRDPTGIFPARE